MRKQPQIFFYILLFVLMAFSATAQTPEQIVRMVEADRANYYYGHGYADDYEQAVQKAKAQLVGDIAVFIKSNATGIISTESGVSMEERIQTYTNMTQLREVETIVLAEEPNFHIFCFLTKESANRMFEERREKVFSYFEEARQAEDKLKMSEALRYYYWSLLVLKTLPDESNVTFVDENQVEQKMLLWLNSHIPEILDNITFQPVAVTGDENWKQLEVAVAYRGQPVADCEYRYWTGRGYSQNVLAKDGRGIAEFSVIPDNLQFYIEYVFSNDAKNVDPELRDIIQMGDRPSWKNNAHTVAATLPSERPSADATAGSPPVDAVGVVAKKAFQALSAPRADSCTLVMEAVKNAVVTRNYAPVEKLCTPNGWELFLAMMKSGNASVVGIPQWQFRQSHDEILCRGLAVSLKYPRSGKTIVENVEFRLDSKSLKINSLSYTLNREAEEDILDDSKKWAVDSRLKLMRFLQEYQTAYALKRADYLESIFSDDALIIVGVELKRAPELEKRISFTNEKQYKFVQKTKAEFISNLQRIFKSAEFVNLQLKDNQILKVSNKEIYGIQIRQIYTSNSYADQGYLFLVVDLRDSDHPIIHVRTWQPDKDPEFGIFDLSKFAVN